MKAQLISEKIGFNREDEPLKKMGIGKKEELPLLKMQEFFNNIDIEMSYQKNDDQWDISFSNNGSVFLNKIDNYTGIYENGNFLIFEDSDNSVFNYEINSWQDLCRGIIEEIIEGGIDKNIYYLQNIKQNLEKIYK
jgi:hypothetical protein